MTEQMQFFRDRYRLIRPLGRGSEGDVFLVYREEVCRFYALKRIPICSECYTEEGIAQYKRLAHGSLPGIIDVFEEEGYLCLVTEYVEGRNLRQLARSGLLNERKILRIGISVCRLLEYLLEQHPPVYVSDLKPENLILDKNRLVLVDIGSLYVAGSGGKRLGTPGYRSGRWMDDEKMEIYSLGKTLEFLTDHITRRESAGRDLKTCIRKCLLLENRGGYGKLQDCRRFLQRIVFRFWFCIGLGAAFLIIAGIAGKCI